MCWRPRGARLAGLLLFLAATACAAPPSASSLSIDAGIGYETQTSPLIRISPQGSLILLDDINRLAGSHVRASLSGMQDWAVGEELRLAVSGDLHLKRSPQTRDLDFSNVSLSSALRWPVGPGFLGIGPGVQRIEVAGRHFRDVTGIHADWTRADERGNHWMVMLDRGRNRHRGDLIDLDSTSTVLMLQHHLAAPLPGVDALDLDLSLARERNDRGFAELSNRNLMLRLGLERSQWGINWGVGLIRQVDRFDDTPLPELPRRKDRSTLLEISAEIALAPGRTLRFDASTVRNQANLALYEDRYRQIGVGVNLSW